MKKPELKEEQWARIAPLLPEPKVSPKGGRRPEPNRPCFEGILWVLRSGARWKDLPGEYPSYSTCRRRLLEWEDKGVWLKVWRTLLAELDDQQRLDWEECFADGSFAPAKKGALRRENQTRKGYKVDGGGRWPGNSSGSPPRLGVAGGSDAHRDDAGKYICAAERSGTAENQGPTAHL